MICKQMLYILTVKGSNSSISNYSIVYKSTLNGFKYWFVSITIQLKIPHLFTHK